MHHPARDHRVAPVGVRHQDNEVLRPLLPDRKAIASAREG